MTVQERKISLETWMATRAVKMGDLKVINNISCNSIMDVYDLADHSAGYTNLQGVCVMSPTYVKPKTAEHVARQLVMVGQRVPSTPVYFYHIPFMTGIAINVNDTLTVILFLFLIKKFIVSKKICTKCRWNKIHRCSNE